MQQAYRALRVISEAQTVHIVLAARPTELILTELLSACMGLHAGDGDDLKAVVLDFVDQPEAAQEGQSTTIPSELLVQVHAALKAVPQPVLAVARASLSEVSSQLIREADFTLFASEVSLFLPLATSESSTPDQEHDRIGGEAAQRLGLATWVTSAHTLGQELERILDMLRNKSSIALRHSKASVHLASQPASSPLEALQRVNQLYLDQVLHTEDAQEGRQAFLEKRQPQWKNR